MNRATLVLAAAALVAACRDAPRGAPDATARDGENVVPTAVAESERRMLHRLRAHFREAGEQTREVARTATSARVRDEAEWLARGYEHVAEHFDTALGEWFDAGAEADAQPPELTKLAGLTDPREKQRVCAREVNRSHQRLVASMHAAEYDAYAEKRELLREIRRDVEHNEGPQVEAFVRAVAEER